MMTTAATYHGRLTLPDPWADPCGSVVRPCFPLVNPLADPSDPYQGKKSAGGQKQGQRHQWRGQHGGWGRNIGVLRVSRVRIAHLSFNPNALRLTHARVRKGQRITGSHGGTLTALGSFRGRRGAGGAEPRLFALHKKIEIEIPFAAVGG